MRIITLHLLLFLSIASISWGIPKDPDEIHDGWMSYHVDDKTTVFSKKQTDNTIKGTFDTPSRSLSMHNSISGTPEEIVLQRVIDLVAQKKTEMCKANPAGEWELNLAADINGNIKIIELKAQASIIVKVKC